MLSIDSFIIGFLMLLVFLLWNAFISLRPIWDLHWCPWRLLLWGCTDSSGVGLLIMSTFELHPAVVSILNWVLNYIGLVFSVCMWCRTIFSILKVGQSFDCASCPCFLHGMQKESSTLFSIFKLTLFSNHHQWLLLPELAMPVTDRYLPSIALQCIVAKILALLAASWDCLYSYTANGS